jgi:methylamine dehydrogenase accessory protein MauD
VYIPTDMTGWWAASYIVLWMLVLILALLLISLARQVGALHLRLGPRGALELDDEGPPLGEAPPPIETRDIDGEAATIGGPGTPQFLLFVSPNCLICRSILPSVPVVSKVGKMAPYVISDAPDELDSREYASIRGATRVILGPGIAETYAVPGTPYAIVLDARGVVRAKGTVNNLEQMEGLVDTATARLRSVLPPAGTGGLHG